MASPAQQDDAPEVMLSIILPSYNHADLIRRHVPALRDYLEGLNIPYEIIVVDDGSHDDGQTRLVAGELGCRYAANPVNQGKGASVRRGMLVARGRFRLYTDADIPYELETIGRFLWYLDFKEFHIVTGDRTLEGSSYFSEIPTARRLASRLFSFIVGRFIVSGLFDTQCGIKGLRAEVAEDLFGVSRINRFAFDVELLYIALKRNYDIKRLPVRLRSQEGDSVQLMRDSLVMLRDLLAIRYHQAVGHYRPRQPVRRAIDTSPRPDTQTSHT